LYRNIAAMDAWGHATLVYEGGADASTAAVILARGYDQATGRALSTEAGRANAAPIVHLLTTWDGFANLRTRTDQVNASTETARVGGLFSYRNTAAMDAWGHATLVYESGFGVSSHAVTGD